MLLRNCISAVAFFSAVRRFLKISSCIIFRSSQLQVAAEGRQFLNLFNMIMHKCSSAIVIFQSQKWWVYWLFKDVNVDVPVILNCSSSGEKYPFCKSFADSLPPQLKDAEVRKSNFEGSKLHFRNFLVCISANNSYIVLMQKCWLQLHMPTPDKSWWICRPFF